MSVAHACNICAAEQIAIDRFMSLLPDDPRVQSLAGVVMDQAFSQRTATLSAWKKAMMSIQHQARDAALNAEFPDFVADLLTRAEQAGYVEEYVMAMFKVLNR